MHGGFKYRLLSIIYLRGKRNNIHTYIIHTYFSGYSRGALIFFNFFFNINKEAN
jgi:hypothetical protein